MTGELSETSTTVILRLSHLHSRVFWWSLPCPAFVSLYALSQPIALINNVLLPAWILMPFFGLKSSPNSPSSLLLRCQHMCIKGASGRYRGMGSRVEQWRWERTVCRTHIGWVKEQYVLSILSRTRWFNYSKWNAGTFTCFLLYIFWHSTGMMTPCMVQRRGSPALGPEPDGNPHHKGSGACSGGAANCASGHRESMPV